MRWGWAAWLSGTVLAAVTSAETLETVVLAERPKAAVLQGEVAVDGVARPDLGRALADSLATELLKTGDYRVFQPEVRSSGGKARDGSEQIASPSLQSVMGDYKLDADLDYVFLISVFGTGADYRFSLKKVRATNHEVVDAREMTFSGKESSLFTSITTAVAQFQKRAKDLNLKQMQALAVNAVAQSRPVAMPVSQRPTIAPDSSPAGANVAVVTPAVDQSPTEESPGLAEYQRYQREQMEAELAKVPKALIYRRLGSIELTNDTWRFCVIRPQEGVKLGVNDAVHVLYDEDGKVYADLRISGTDSGRLIADYGRTPRHHPLFRGDAVYGWATP